MLGSSSLMRPAARALLLFMALGAPVHAETGSSPATIPSASTPSTTVVPPYPGMTLLVGSQPAPTRPGPTQTPALERFETYVTSDGYEQVVRFYQAKLGLSPTTAHRKNLAATFPGQPIPSRCQGRRSVFRIAPSANALSAQSVEQVILGRALGGTNVVVSDFSVDPRTHQIVDQTSIVLLVYR